MPTTDSLIQSSNTQWWIPTSTVTGSTTPVRYIVNYNGLNTCFSDNSFSTVTPSYPDPPASNTATLSQECYDRRIAETEARLRNEWQAQERARALLLAHLSPEQKQEFETHQRFHVQSADGNREYVIRQGRVQNITLLSRSGWAYRLCVHPEIECPDEDTMLCQKLLIETDEQELWRTANKQVLAHGTSRPSAIPLLVSAV